MPPHLYLSPHLDDAVLSCGGLIHAQVRAGQPVVVVTLCAGQPGAGPGSAFAQSLHARWGTVAAEAVSDRQAEDRAALARLGAAGRHLAVPDCIYRTHPLTGQALYASEEALWGPLDPAEESLVQQCAATLGEILRRYPGSQFYAPLGLGQHVDHQLARRAAALTGAVSAYYEDYPYADREANLSPNSRVTGAETQGLSPELLPLTAADLGIQSRAVAAYTSQLSTFWASPAEIEPSLRAYASRVGGGALAARVWRPPAP